jgi:hypothetical protein
MFLDVDLWTCPGDKISAQISLAGPFLGSLKGGPDGEPPSPKNVSPDLDYSLLPRAPMERRVVGVGGCLEGVRGRVAGEGGDCALTVLAGAVGCRGLAERWLWI